MSTPTPPPPEPTSQDRDDALRARRAAILALPAAELVDLWERLQQLDPRS